jgi:hypothetical protein
MEGPAGNTASQEELKKYERLRDAQFSSDLGAVLETPQGRRVLYRVIFSVAGVESLSYTGVNEATNFREGRRDVGLTLIREAQEMHPELYLLMLSEAVREASEVTMRMKRVQEEAHGRSDE